METKQISPILNHPVDSHSAKKPPRNRGSLDSRSLFFEGAKMDCGELAAKGMKESVIMWILATVVNDVQEARKPALLFRSVEKKTPLFIL